jgi:hypothetical protein
MSMPLYHYVLPVTVFDLARGAKYGEDVIKLQTKRWDTLAWFQVTLHKGDFEKSFNLGSISGGFGTPASGNSKAAKSVDELPSTLRKPAAKKLEPITSMPTFLAEYMQLNATRTTLAATMDVSDDNATNQTIMEAIDFRREQLAQLLKPAQ